jgi:hypothetical protein
MDVLFTRLGDVSHMQARRKLGSNGDGFASTSIGKSARLKDAYPLSGSRLYALWKVKTLGLANKRGQNRSATPDIGLFAIFGNLVIRSLAITADRQARSHRRREFVRRLRFRA